MLNAIESGTVLQIHPDGDLRGLSVPKSQWHNAESLESGTVILERKDGKWKALGGACKRQKTILKCCSNVTHGAEAI